MIPPVPIPALEEPALVVLLLVVIPAAIAIGYALGWARGKHAGVNAEHNRLRRVLTGQR